MKVTTAEVVRGVDGVDRVVLVESDGSLWERRTALDFDQVLGAAEALRAWLDRRMPPELPEAVP